MSGDLSYDPAGVVAATELNLAWVLGACALSFVGAYLQYFGALSMGFRHRTYSIPLIGNLWNFAHDTSFVANYAHWFGAVDFWLVRAFWFALVAFALCECVVTYQLLRYAHTEVFPGMTRLQAIASYAGLQVFTYGVFWWFMSMISDPYYLLSFTTTVILAPLFNIALMRSRGSRRGFSRTMLVGYVLLSVGFWLWMALIDPYFRMPFMWIIAGGNTAIALMGLRVFAQLPEYVPAAAPRAA